MGERLTAANGKRYRAWGTREICPACGECLCFKCHPRGPCVHEEKQAVASGQWAVGSGQPITLSR